MSSYLLSHPTHRLALATISLLAPTLVGGCNATPSMPAAMESKLETCALFMPNDWIPVARYGRYTLVELTPEAAQRDPLPQTDDTARRVCFVQRTASQETP